MCFFFCFCLCIFYLFIFILSLFFFGKTKTTATTFVGAWAMQVLYNTASEVSNMPYDQEQCDSALQAFCHEMGDLEYRGKWARCWCVCPCKKAGVVIHAMF
jgi:uncharacterized membrane-anchored protein YitT (DUF2179 family)